MTALKGRLLNRIMSPAIKRSVLKRNSWLQAKKGSSADERTDLIVDSIIRTLTYSDHFNFPLTKEEVFSRLIASRHYARLQVSTALNTMVRQGIISSRNKYYYLHGRSSLVISRTRSATLSSPLQQKAKLLASQLGKLPGVLAIYLTGSLAMSNTNGKSDIDFMIITKSRKLWTTRFILTVITTLKRLRRTPGSNNHAGKLCLNLYLTPDSYLLPPSKHSLYTAYELIQAVPLHDPYHTHQDLLAANSWISTFLPNTIIPKTSPSPKQSNWNTGALESCLYHLQRLYMLPKLTKEFITPNSAFFHPHDPGKLVLKKIQ